MSAINEMIAETEKLVEMGESMPLAHNQAWTPEMVKFLAISTFAFLGFSLVLCSILLWRKGADGMHILRVFGIITILGLSALLLFVGYSNEQLTPIVGLFGAIAGYLLGKDSSTTVKPSTDAGK